MNEKIEAIYRNIARLENELEQEIIAARERLHYRIEGKKILFEKSVIAYHKKLRKSIYRFIRESTIVKVLVAPVIYFLIVPMALIDLFALVYQAICFPVYGIRRVPRSDFIVLDRHELEYLNFLEKLNCAYCGYANGLAAYLREIAARTEEYWCPIKHARKIKNPHSKYYKFEEYGDAEGFRERWRKNR